MRSAAVARGFARFGLVPLASTAVLVFHGAAFAQQADATAKAQTAKEQPADTAAKQPDASGKSQADAQPKEADKAAPASPAAEAPQELPPEYGPPPGYRRGPGRYPPPPPPDYGPYYQDDYYDSGYPPPPPPPRYYRPRRFMPVPARSYPEPVSYRSFFFGFGLGVGGVTLFDDAGGKNTSRPGLGYNLHFGFGVAPRWSIVLSGDGAYAYFGVKDTNESWGISQTVWTIGPQVFVTRKLYARAGVGVASKSIDLGYDDYYYSNNGYSDSGLGWTAAVGFEFLQSWHVSVGLEAAASMGHYANPDNLTGSKTQGTMGINFIVNLF